MLAFRQTDGGRYDAGFRGKTPAGDCVVRALTLHTGRSYTEVYDTIASMVKADTGVRSARNGVSKRISRKAFVHFGLTKMDIPLTGPRPTLSECYERFGNCIVTTRKHILAIVNGRVCDTYDTRLSHLPDGTTRERRASAVWRIVDSVHLYVLNSSYYTGRAFGVCGAIVNGDNHTMNRRKVTCVECRKTFA